MTIEDPGSDDVTEADPAKVNGNDREKRKRVRGWRSKLAEIIDPE